MTQADIIRMAREAGFITGTSGPLNTQFVTQVAGSFAVELERFASLVRKQALEDATLVCEALAATTARRECVITLRSMK